MMQCKQHMLRVRVQSKTPVSLTVMEFVLEPVDMDELPAWTPGAHIGVRLPDGTDRQFSLSGDPADRSVYRIAVLLERDGRGGSIWLHDEIDVGSELEILSPRNNFSLQPAESYQLVAGGIGITPLLPMILQLQADGAQWHLTYLGRSKSTMAFIDELEAYGERVTFVPTDETERWDVAARVSEMQDCAIYACGPERLLKALETAHDNNSASTQLHVERFTPRLRDVAENDGPAFDVELAQSGMTVPVPSGKSVLIALEEAGVAPPYSCREGTCGTCESLVISGMVDHRDSILDEEEQAANDVMMICVSRSKSSRIVLDL